MPATFLKPKNVLLFLLLGCLFSFPSFAQRNITEEYQQKVSSSPEPLAQLRDFNIIFVPGFLSNLVIASGRFPILMRWGIGRYFTDQMNWLTANGVQNERVAIESEETPDHNANMIRERIIASDRPVILVCHSKGNVDALQALLKFPETQTKVKGWIAFQGAFGGSPIADWVLDNNFLNYFAVWLLKKMGGTKDALASLREKDSKSYLKRHASEILALNQRMPIISFRSWIEDKPWRIDTLLFLTRNLMLRHGRANDGLVPIENAFLPGSEVISLPNLDHIDPVMKSWIRKFDRVQTFRTLCGMVLGRMGDLTS